MKCKVGLHMYIGKTINMTEQTEERVCLYCQKKQWRRIHKFSPIYSHKWKNKEPENRRSREGSRSFTIQLSEAEHNKIEYLESKGYKVNDHMRKALMRIYITEKSKDINDAIRKIDEI